MDKTRLEERLEEEQEYIVNKLTKQLDEVLVEKQYASIPAFFFPR